jgi:hypothetical protein
MSKVFNTSADCKPALHYMVDIRPKLRQIKDMIDKGLYFTINRARQYGKTTTLKALRQFLKDDYLVISLDFQMMGSADFENESVFVEAFAREILDTLSPEAGIEQEILDELLHFTEASATNKRLSLLFRFFSKWCGQSDKKIVLIIDEVDSASNNQIFLDFLSQLRGSYINRDIKPTFQSVILAGVYDIKNIRQKMRSDDSHKRNSPWNIAADFLVDMSFSVTDIAGMLMEYEEDHHTGMDISGIARLLYDYTSGYPFLVSRICQLIDERVAGNTDFPTDKDAWTKEGFLTAMKLLLSESNTLFDSLINKLDDDPQLYHLLYDLLFQGKEIVYVIGIHSIEMALMFGFVKKSNNVIIIANRIFETLLYNLFLTSPSMQQNKFYSAALKDKNQFIKDGHLDMKLILEKFVIHFDSLYGDQRQSFLEEDGRRFFLLYLRPIINGTGNYYIESRTRNMERTDVIVDYLGEQFVIEMKIWHGNTYHTRGEAQLCDYLDYYHLKKGYMLSFNFNKTKEIGVKEIILDDKILIEAVV